MGAILVAAIAAAPAHGWDKEPTSFWGLELGRSLRAQLPECTGRVGLGDIPIYDAVQQTRCWERSIGKSKFVPLQANPPLGVPAWGTALTVDDRVEGVLVKFRHFERLHIEALLIERFGRPTESTSNRFTTRGGAQLVGAVHRWKGVNVEIVYSEYSDTIDRGHVLTTTRAYLEAERNAPADAAKAHRGNL